jgi:hypothetical protein
MLLHAVTIFLGAFLLFQIQPLMGKYLLPWFGGGPGVWTTCLLFFQTVLLGGYAYAHWLSSQLPARRQAIVHTLLLLISLAFLPIAPGTAWKPTGNEEPVGRLLMLLATSVGLPYLILSATGPLLQRWFSLQNPGASPWRLYALSNAGSLLALLSFPFLFEPLASRGALAGGWSAGLVLFVCLCGSCAWRLYRTDATATVDPGSGEPDRPVAGLERLLWVVLPGIASLLLVATTNKVCLDIAAVPFLWVLPLTVYLLSFILCFDHPRWYSRRWNSLLLVAGCGATARCLDDATVPFTVQIGVYIVTLFAACMTCHGELHRLRPSPRRLTGYYLTIATGGAAGSCFVALLAPVLFADYRELQLGLVLLLYFTGIISLLYRSRSLAEGAAVGALACTFLIPALQAETGRGAAAWFSSWVVELVVFYRAHTALIAALVVACVFALRHGWRVGGGEWQRRMSAVLLLLSVTLGGIFVIQAKVDGNGVFAAARNFYGAYKILLYGDESDRSRSHLLSHGGITHGLQFTHPDYIDWPTTYYGATSGVGRAFDSLDGARRIGLVGLGAGTLAAYGRPDDILRFYEIDPAIVDVAHRHFSYLQRTPAAVEIQPGDARLSMEAELRAGTKQHLDLLILDAFSGDAIPIHLLTREAMAVYLQHLQPDGLIAVHISNRHLDLRPVVESLALHHGLHFVTISDTVEKDDWWIYSTTWMLLSPDPARLAAEEIKPAAEEPPDESAEFVVWTDDHASLFNILK